MNKTKLFINPAAGRWRGKKIAPKIRNYLQQRGLKTNAVFTREKGDLINLVQKAILDDYQHIIVAGGDGTIHEAINGFMLAKKTVSKSVWNTNSPTLAILPIGTGNDFIKATNIPKSLMSACDYLLQTKPTTIDVGKITTHKGNSAYFINNIGAGFDGKVGLTAAKIPFIRGFIVYVLALLWHLIKGIPNPRVNVEIDSHSYQQTMTLIAISNGTHYGGSFKIAPKAKLNDQKLDTILAPAKNRMTVIPLLLQLIFGKHLKNEQVTFHQAEAISINSEEPIVVIADGELIEEKCNGFAISIEKNALQLII